MITLVDLIEKLKQEDNVHLLELLDIYSDELVDRFQDKIEEKYDTLVLEYTDEETECVYESN